MDRIRKGVGYTLAFGGIAATFVGVGPLSMGDSRGFAVIAVAIVAVVVGARLAQAPESSAG